MASGLNTLLLFYQHHQLQYIWVIIVHIIHYVFHCGLLCHLRVNFLFDPRKFLGFAFILDSQLGFDLPLTAWTVHLHLVDLEIEHARVLLVEQVVLRHEIADVG